MPLRYDDIKDGKVVLFPNMPSGALGKSTPKVEVIKLNVPLNIGLEPTQDKILNAVERHKLMREFQLSGCDDEYDLWWIAGKRECLIRAGLTTKEKLEFLKYRKAVNKWFYAKPTGRTIH